MRIPALVVGLAIACGCCAGCGVLQLGRLPASDPYPAALEKGPTLDVQVAVDREQVSVTLTNTTARSFEDTTIWLNAWYAFDMRPLAIGETRRIRISRFRDKFGDRMPAGGFFATQRPKPIVLAELESDGVMYGLIVVRGESD